MPVTKQCNLALVEGGDAVHWEGNRSPGGKQRQPTTWFMTGCRLTSWRLGAAAIPMSSVGLNLSVLHLEQHGPLCGFVQFNSCVI